MIREFYLQNKVVPIMDKISDIYVLSIAVFDKKDNVISSAILVTLCL